MDTSRYFYQNIFSVNKSLPSTAPYRLCRHDFAETMERVGLGALNPYGKQEAPQLETKVCLPAHVITFDSTATTTRDF